MARLTPLLLITGLLISAPTGTAQGASAQTAVAAKPTAAKVAVAAGFDVSPSMRAVAKQSVTAKRDPGALNRPERGPAAAGGGFAGDAAVQRSKTRAGVAPEIAAPSVNFEGIAATANIPILGGIPIPPDPVGDVGPSQYVEMVNTAWAVYSKTGSLLLGPLSWPPSGPASRCPIARTTPATRSWSTTSWPTAGF